MEEGILSGQTDPPPGRLERLLGLAVRWGVPAVLLFGAALRVLEYAHRRSLWVDEAFLALNVLDRGYLELLEPLDWLQIAPVGFLWMQRTAVHLLGSSEWALRFGPLVLGIALLFLMVPVARRLLHPSAALPVVASLACMGVLILYSNEAKPYIGDVFACSLVLLVATRTWEKPERWPIQAALLLALPFFSLPAAFFGAGAVAAMALRENRLRIDRPVWVTALAWTLGSGLSAALGSDADITYEMQMYWSGTFLFDPPARLVFFLDQMNGFLGALLWPLPLQHWASALLLGGLLTLGAWQVTRVAGLGGLALVVVPIVAAITAVVLRLYPFAGRLWLWSFPLLVVLVTGAGYRLVGRRRVAALGLAVVLSLAIGLTRGRTAFYFARHPNLGQHARPVIEELERRVAEGDVIYVFARSNPAWLYYQIDWADPPPALDEIFDMGTLDGPIYVNAWATPPMSDEELALLHMPGPAGATVLLGRSSGFRIHHMNRPQRDRDLDPDWSAIEVQRLRLAVGTGCAWVFGSHVLPPEEEEFMAEVTRRGGRLGERIEGVAASAEQVCFEPPGSSPPRAASAGGSSGAQDPPADEARDE